MQCATCHHRSSCETHITLSILFFAGMDGKVKIWDVANLGGCMRTYLGHSKAVRDVNFSADGRKFLTTSYDRFVKVSSEKSYQTWMFACFDRKGPLLSQNLVDSFYDRI